MARNDDRELSGPSKLAPPRVSVVRLNRRVLYVAGTVLIVAVIVGLVALRAQGSRLERDPSSPRASQLTARPGDRWFDKIPDREPSAPAAVAVTLPSTPAPPLHTPAPPPPAKTLSEAELEAQRQERALRGAMAAPIAAGAFEARSATARGGTERASTGVQSTQPPAASIVPAAAATAARAVAGGLSPASREIVAPVDRPDVLPTVLRGAVSQYEVKAGTIIPAVLLTGLNSDLPGQLIAQVREPVFDTETGQSLLVPQGARSIGLYDHQVVYGQERVLVAWKRIIFPNGASLSLKDGMPGTDSAGAAGFHDQVNRHLVRVFGNAPSSAQACSSPRSRTSEGASLGQPLAMSSVPPWVRSWARHRAT